MVCTDLAGRGLDIEGLAIVINAEVPLDDTKFIHRLGRVGRLGTEGKGYTVCCVTSRREMKLLRGITIRRRFLRVGKI